MDQFVHDVMELLIISNQKRMLDVNRVRMMEIASTALLDQEKDIGISFRALSTFKDALQDKHVTMREEMQDWLK